MTLFWTSTPELLQAIAEAYPNTWTYAPADPEGEREVDEEKAKERTERMLKDPKFKRPKGHPDDEATRDGALDDPALQEGDPE